MSAANSKKTHNCQNRNSERVTHSCVHSNSALSRKSERDSFMSQVSGLPRAMYGERIFPSRAECAGGRANLHGQVAVAVLEGSAKRSKRAWKKRKYLGS